MSGTLRIGGIEVHPAANLFPEMGDSDLDALYESVRAHGVRVPLVFFDGKLIDGRNRLRASVMAGLDTDNLPRRTLPKDIDPYLWAWDANCTRLDYTPAQKAAIRIKIEEASGELARMHAAIEEQANRARSEKLRDVPRDSRTSRDVPPSKPPRRESKAAAAVASAAHVSPATVQRVQKLKREDPAAFEVLAATGKLPPKPAPQPPPKKRRINLRDPDERHDAIADAVEPLRALFEDDWEDDLPCSDLIASVESLLERMRKWNATAIARAKAAS